MKKQTKLITLLRETTIALTKCYDDSTLRKQYAWWMIEAITGKSQASLLTSDFIDWSDAQQKKLESWIERQVSNHEPLQYILGSVPFSAVNILVKPPILIPRPETEEWTSVLINHLKKLKNQKLVILDLCCGSGCIAIALAKALPKAQVYGADINNQAIALSQTNGRHNQCNNVTFLRSDLFKDISPTFKFDMIVSNPPYIPAKQWQSLDDSVKNWEDKNALIAAEDGLAIIKKIIDDAPDYLQENKELRDTNIPQLIIEIDYNQGKAVADYMKEKRYLQIKIHEDLEGKERVVTGRIL